MNGLSDWHVCWVNVFFVAPFLHHLAKITGSNFILVESIAAEMYGIVLDKNLRLDGFEPSTLSLKVRCSTAELKSQKEMTPTGFEPVLSE